MIYQHNSETGITHALFDPAADEETTYCGKPVAFDWDIVEGPATCKTCLNSLHASRAWRAASSLEALCSILLEDAEQRPGAYLHADKSTMASMRAVLYSLKVERSAEQR